MNYNVVFTEAANRNLDVLVKYIINEFCNKQAAKHLLESIADVIDNIGENPYMYSRCKEPFLYFKGYRRAIITGTKYILIYKKENTNVYIMGIFHSLEDYKNKL